MTISPKTAVVEISLPVEDFLLEWIEMGEESEPTQKDYDFFLEENMRSYLRNNGDCSKIILK